MLLLFTGAGVSVPPTVVLPYEDDAYYYDDNTRAPPGQVSPLQTSPLGTTVGGTILPPEKRL